MRVFPIAIGLLAASAGAAGAQPFPLEAGNRWEFVEILFPPGSPPDTVGAGGFEIGPAGAAHGADWFPVAEAIAGSDSVRIDSFGRLIGLVDGEERLLLDFTAEDGATYPLDQSLGTYEITVRRDVAVDSPAGRFERSVRFDAHNIEGVLDADWSLTFAPGVGPVQAVNGQGQVGLLEHAVLSGWDVPARLAATLTTDRTSYAMEEPVVLTLRVENAGPTHQRLSAACNVPTYRIDGLSIGPGICIPETEWYTFRPGSWREWSWIHLPAILGLSETGGTHLVSAAYGSASASASFAAPAYVGGWLEVSITATANPTAEADLREALEASVIESRTLGGGDRHEIWAIRGTTLENALAWYANWPGISLASRRFMEYTHVTTVRTEPVAGRSADPDFAVFPNPAADQVTFRGGSRAFGVELYDLLGRRVGSAVSSGGRAVVRVAALPRGLYLYRVLGGASRRGGTIVAGR